AVHTWPPSHAVFLRLRGGRKNQSSAETEKPASSLPSSPPLPPRLLTRNLGLGLAESSLSLLSLAQHHVALTGIKGLMILGLPKRWGKSSDTTPVAERFFTRSASPTPKHAAWYPREWLDPHVAPLTSDNVVRIYPLRRAYTASLGETALAFDFGPLSAVPKHITFLTHVSLSHSPGAVGKLLGPLPMHPANEENYGYGACAGLCLPCVANNLVITTASGMFHLCVSWDSRADLIPSLYAFECVELELALKLASAEGEPFDSDFSCPVKLHRDPKCPSRYHCTHEAGVHSVGLPWIHKLHKFLGSDEEDRDSLQELAAEQKCFVEHILCRKPLPCSQPAPFRGFWIIPDILGPTMICITSTYEYLIRPLLSTSLPSVHILVETPDSFEKHIRSILQHSVANPAFFKSSEKDTALPPKECLYLRELDEHLADKYEDAKEKQEDIMNRMKKLIPDQLQHLGNAIKWVTMKKDYQPQKMEKVLSPQKPTITLRAYQRKCIQSILKEKGEHIREMVKQINDIRNHVNF
ncbi:hypothetical protein FD755_010044, partial [Muntiacus reevesi]